MANRYDNKDTSYTRMQILKYVYDSKYKYRVDNDRFILFLFNQ